MLPLMVASPLLTAFLIVLLDVLHAGKRAVQALFIAGAILPIPVAWLSGGGSEIVGGWPREAGIEVALTEVNTPFIVGELVLFTFVSIYSLQYFSFRDKKTPKVLALLLLVHTGLLGAFIARDFFNFYIYMEIASVSAFALVALSKESSAKRAAFKYLMLSLLASYMFIFSLGLIYMETGYLNAELASRTAVPSRELGAAIAIATASLLLKAGIFPLHSWLPDAHSRAPTPVSALLSGAVVKAPAYGMVLLFSSLPVGETLRTVLMGTAVASVFFGIGMALLQRDAKRLLAYHTVSQMGYVLLGIASLNFVGAAYYAMAHSIFKGGLFLAVGSISTKSRELGEFGYKNESVIAVSVLMLSLAIGGVSPFVGAYAKGLVSSGLSDGWKLAVLLGTIGTLISFTKLNYYLMRGQSPSLLPAWKLSSFGLALAAFLAGLLLGTGINLKDALNIAIAVISFAILKRTGLLEKRVRLSSGDVGKEINVLVAVFVAAVVLLLSLQ
ncbi:proton-conducting transporter transmembrane domain-containing protein [Thermococcus pacificus]|uniref:Cation:proton antiporter n=1 Tax=Thermococcus pacificus TaxID=71998 RepID=A0A218P541_9EURY|nr:proton-conducting transporter membrane subunit [Thermococcus pacificus]ASJ05902.1 cation:proton antiporter [Thermococcus pacificus]